MADELTPELTYVARLRLNDGSNVEKTFETSRRYAPGDSGVFPTGPDGEAETDLAGHIWRVKSVEVSENPSIEGVLVLDYQQVHPDHQHNWEEIRQDGSQLWRCACGASRIDLPSSRAAARTALRSIFGKREPK